MRYIHIFMLLFVNMRQTRVANKTLLNYTGWLFYLKPTIIYVRRFRIVPSC